MFYFIYLFKYRVHHKFVQSLKIYSKRRNARKKFLFVPIWSEGHCIFFHVKKKETARGRLYVVLRRFIQIRLSITYLAGNRSDIRCRQHAFSPDRALVVKLFYKNREPTTVTSRKFRTEKGLKAQKNPILLNGILNLVRRFQKRGVWRIVHEMADQP